MREKEFEKLVDEVTERVTVNILGADWVCYRCGDKSVIERVEKLEQKVARLMRSMDDVEIVRCAECKHCYVDGENVRYNVCDLNHNKVQSDDWFCADGERSEGNG